jgi:hypothetical protein
MWSIAPPPHESASGARRSLRVTTLLGVLEGNNAGCRKLPRQFIRGLAVPIRPADVVRALDARSASLIFMVQGGPKAHVGLCGLCSGGRVQILVAGFAPDDGRPNPMFDARVRKLMRSPRPAAEWHGGELETAMMLAVAPSLVRRSVARRLPSAWAD